MTGTDIQRPAASAEIEALSSAFASFVKVTEELRSSYEKLRERADRIDVELAATNEKLRQILVAIPSGVVVTDASGTITSFNAAAEKIIGITEKECLGKNIDSLRDAQGQAFLLGLSNPSNAPQLGRERQRQDGKRIVLGGESSKISDQGGNAVGHVEVVEDLTELWELRERIHRLDKLAALGEMSAVIAHEIRNPLNGVQGFADLLDKKLVEKDEKLASYARNIVKGVREVDSIIADLLSFASPERFHPMSVELEPVIAQSIETCLRGLSSNALQKFQFHTDCPKNLRIVGDTVKLGQVFRNLFSNAMEAMTQGGNIRVQAKQEGNKAKVTIQDEGTGIPQEIRSKVFDPFFTTKTQGTGLGLAIVRKLVELHGGEISLEESQKGACFQLILPARV